MVNCDAKSFLRGKLIKKIHGGRPWPARTTLPSVLRAITAYEVLTRFRPSRPIHHMPIDSIDSTLRGELSYSARTDEFISEPRDAFVSLRMHQLTHTARLLQPHLHMAAAGDGIMSGLVHVVRSCPYAPTEPHPVSIDFSMTSAQANMHGDNAGFLSDLDALREFTQPL